MKKILDAKYKKANFKKITNKLNELKFNKEDLKLYYLRNMKTCSMAH